MNEEQFIKDVANHDLKVLLDQGVYRHLKFKASKTGWKQWFEIVTWPGMLSFSGDMGAWTFSRFEDMFTFFRGATISPSYWAEKIQGECRRSGTKEFNANFYRDNILSCLEGYDLDDHGVSKEDVLKALRKDVFSCEDEHEMRNALAHFNHEGFEFSDSWEIEGKQFTDRYLWCCHAIVWAIKQYDAGAKTI